MSNEKYLNYYVEILTGTMTDAVIRNVSLQANARVTEEILEEQAKRIEELSVLEANRGAETNAEVLKLNGTITNLNTTIGNLNNELNDLRRQRGEFEAVKNQVQHVDTFRNELVKAQEKIKELNAHIEYLQLTPAKRKKIDDAKQTKTVDGVTAEVKVETTETIKDGGSF
jgi:chromosome segregation ATPase